MGAAWVECTATSILASLKSRTTTSKLRGSSRAWEKCEKQMRLASLPDLFETNDDFWRSVLFLAIKLDFFPFISISAYFFLTIESLKKSFLLVFNRFFSTFFPTTLKRKRIFLKNDFYQTFLSTTENSLLKMRNKYPQEK